MFKNLKSTFVVHSTYNVRTIRLSIIFQYLNAFCLWSDVMLRAPNPKALEIGQGFVVSLQDGLGHIKGKDRCQLAEYTRVVRV